MVSRGICAYLYSTLPDSTFTSAHLLVMETNTTVSGLEPLIGIEELAEYLGVPIKTLYKWRQEGTGPCSVRVGRHVRYFVSDVRDWLSQQRGLEQVGAAAEEAG